MQIKNSFNRLISVLIISCLFSFNTDSVSAEKIHCLKILHTNDVHGRLAPVDYYGKNNVGGFAARAKLIKDIKSETENVLVLDAGDFAQGTLFFKFFDGIPDVKFMSKVGYDAAELGNHEFDKGLELLEKMADSAEFPLLCANIKFLNNSELQKKINSYVIKDFDGFKVGIIGVIAEDLRTIVNNTGGFVVYDVAKTVRNIVEKIDSQVDLIIVLSHIGIKEDIKLAKAVPEIDLIVGGHSHTFRHRPKRVFHNGDLTLVVQTGEFGIYLGNLDLVIEDKDIKEYKYRLIPVKGEFPDKYFEKKITKLSEIILKESSQKIGEIKIPPAVEQNNTRKKLTKTGTLVALAIKEKCLDVDIVLQNAGGIRKSGFAESFVSKKDVFELYPFENTVVIAEIKGSDLKSMLETSSAFLPEASGGFLQSLGLEYNVNTKKMPQILSDDKLSVLKEGERVSEIKINDKPLISDKYYKVAVNDYMFNGGNGYSQFENAKNVIKTGIFIQEAIIDFVKKNSPVFVKVEDKINLY